MFPAPVWARHRAAPARTKPRNRQTAKPQNLRFISDLQFLLRARNSQPDSAFGLGVWSALSLGKQPTHGRTGHGRTGEGREAGFTPLFSSFHLIVVSAKHQNQPDAQESQSVK